MEVLAAADGRSPIFPSKQKRRPLIDQQWQYVEKPAEGEANCFDLKTAVLLANGKKVEVTEQGLLICHRGEYRAWVNHCPHAGTPLDWGEGHFFSENGEHLVCHTHGALFDPLSGDCLSGPCPRGLFSLNCREAGDRIQVPTTISDLEGE